jgi:acyl-CoA dehydrogenase
MPVCQDPPPTDLPALLATVRSIAREVAAPHAAEVDARARFPRETVDALRQAGLLSAAVPHELGGAGLAMRELAPLCAALAQGCGASAMVYAMHLSQLASIVRHRGGSEFWADWLRQQVRQQWLLASMTSEVGTWGDTRSSKCALASVAADRTRFKLHKEATTGSYCASADAILVTCRRHAEAAASDQLLVLVRSSDCSLVQTGDWDTLGMRGTVSPGYTLRAEGDAAQVLPVPYGDIAAQTMVPYTHILWAALWWGLAADAQAKAGAWVRGQARKSPGQTPPTAIALAELSAQMQLAKLHWEGLAQAFDTATPDALSGIAWRLKLNHLKTTMSDAAPRLVHQALQIVGMAGYRNDSPYSLGRQYRDALSGALMINNERLVASSAALLLVFKDD